MVGEPVAGGSAVGGSAAGRSGRSGRSWSPEAGPAPGALAPGALAPGAMVAGYRLEQRIGAGGMAVVFRATDERLGRTVALKVVTPALAGDDSFRERFIRESRAAAAVDHPHIIPVYGAGEARGILYLAMRYVSGGDLGSVLRREGPLPAERAAFLLSPVASALDAAHAAGLVHRDVKPANVLVDMSPGRPDHPYLSDFGLAKGTTSATGLTGTGQFIGTIDYIAPEQISGGRAHVQTDQYALACVAFTLLTARLPFAREAPMAVLWAHLNDPPPSVTAYRFDLPPAVDQVLGRALAKDPAARYPSCGAFADALRAALGLGSYSVPAPAYPGPSGRGGIPPSAPSRSMPPSAYGPVGSGAGPGASAAAAVGTGSGAVAGGPTRPPFRPGRWRVTATTVAALAASAAFAAFMIHLTSGTKPQESSGGTGSQVTRSAGAPTSAASSAGDAATPGGGGGVTGKPVRFTNPGSVPNVATGIDSDDSLVTVGTNGTVYAWDMTARQVTSQTAAPRGADFTRAAISPVGDTVAVQASDGTTYISQGEASPADSLPAGERLYPGSIALSGLTIATGDAAGTGVDVWADISFASKPAVTLTNPDGGAALTSVALSVDASLVAASDDSGRTYVWNANTATHLHVLKPSDGSVVNCSVFSYGGGAVNAANGLLVTGNRDGRAYLWNAASGALIRSVRDPGGGAVDTVAVGFGGGLVATAGSGNAVYLWDATTGESLGTVTDPGGDGVVSLALDTDDSQLAVADKNGTTYVWTLAD